MPATQTATSFLAFATFGELLKYLRRRAQLTQRELSIAVGYSEAHISRLEQNQRAPDLATLAALFVPALHLEDEPEVLARLLELAAVTRGERLPRAASITVTQSVAHEVTETIEVLEGIPPNNLPLQLTSFVGRERELDQVKRLLLGTRLVTLTGPGGCGKTRLALRIAAEAAPAYRHGVWLVELAALSDPALVLPAAATAIGVPEQSGRPLIESLIGYLRSRQALLVFDNCEHMVTAVAQVAEALLRACPDVRIMATSRELLAVPGEVSFDVPPLSLPESNPQSPLESIVQYEATRLFVERALSTLPGFTLTRENAPAVVQVCHRLDGMPLAIELAAARIRVLAVEQIAARLDDRFKLLTGGSRTALPRHQTLRAVIDWSYDLLSEPEQTLFRRLSIFAGGWTLEAVESVCHPSDALDLLSNLVNKSLIVVERPHTGAARYHMLETVRQYSHDRLIETGELDSIRGRHFEFFLRLAEESELKLLSAERRTWLERLEVEHDNVRAALDHRPSSGYGESTARLAGALFWFWQSRGYLSEACARLGRILQAMPEDVSVSPPGEAAVWAKALWAAGSLAWLQGDYASGRSQLEESVKIWRQLGASGERGLAISLRELVIVATYQGDLTSARSVSEESIRLCRKTASRWDLALALYNQGLVHEMQGESAIARSNFEVGLSLFRELDEMWGASVALFGLGRIAGRQGDYVTALSLLEECLALLRADKDPLSIAEALYLLGEVAQRLGDTERAARRYAECLALTQDMGDAVIVGLALHNLGKLAQLHGQLGRAARLFAAAKSFRDPSASTTPWSLASHADCEQDIATLHSALGDVVFEAAQAEGQAMTLAQAISYALEDDAGLPRE